MVYVCQTLEPIEKVLLSSEARYLLLLKPSEAIKIAPDLDPFSRETLKIYLQEKGSRWTKLLLKFFPWLFSTSFFLLCQKIFSLLLALAILQAPLFLKINRGLIILF